MGGLILDTVAPILASSREHSGVRGFVDWLLVVMLQIEAQRGVGVCYNRRSIML